MRQHLSYDTIKTINVGSVGHTFSIIQLWHMDTLFEKYKSTENSSKAKLETEDD